MTTAGPPQHLCGRANLRSATMLCVDGSQQSLDILCQILYGFGVERVLQATSIEDAQVHLQTKAVDLLITDANVGQATGSSLIRWLRQSSLEPNRFVPCLLVSGHLPRREILAARDCGANFVVAKPLSPSVLLERILWMGRQPRAFVDCETYSGPDRRFRFEGVPETGGRRATDLSADLGNKTGENMSQGEIDSLLKPMKVSL